MYQVYPLARESLIYFFVLFQNALLSSFARSSLFFECFSLFPTDFGRSSGKNNSCHFGGFACPFLQSPRPATEPRNLENPKVHFKVREMPFWTPRPGNMAPKANVQKVPFFLGTKMSQNRLFGHFKAIFSGAPKMAFFVLGFRGSKAGRGDCEHFPQTLVEEE